MAIFLRHSHNIKPPLWGSFSDRQYAIRKNLEKIYHCDPDNEVLIMPLFWGLPALDYSGKANHGTNHGSVYKNGSLDFNGDDYIDVGDPSSLILNRKFTIAACIEPHNLGIYQAILSHGAQEWYLRSNTAGKLEFLDSQVALILTSNTALDTNMECHVAVTVSAGSTATVTAYLDGSSDGQTTTMHNFADGVVNMTIGVELDHENNKYNYFDGLISEVRVSNAVCSADQIALFNDRPWDLYRPVSRPIWSVPSVGVAPTSVFYGPLVGPLGGPI